MRGKSTNKARCLSGFGWLYRQFRCITGNFVLHFPREIRARLKISCRHLIERRNLDVLHHFVAKSVSASPDIPMCNLTKSHSRLLAILLSGAVLTACGGGSGSPAAAAPQAASSLTTVDASPTAIAPIAPIAPLAPPPATAPGSSSTPPDTSTPPPVTAPPVPAPPSDTVVVPGANVVTDIRFQSLSSATS
jgi:hypothetical protein